MAYFHMTGEKPVDLSIIRSRLLPGTTQVCTFSPWPLIPQHGAALDGMPTIVQHAMARLPLQALHGSGG